MIRKRNLFIILLSLMIAIFCVSFDYVYVDNQTLQRQLSYLNNGFVAIVLQIDPTKDDTSKNYATAGMIIREKIIEKKTTASTELIQLILDITNKNKRYEGDGWYPTYDIYIKYTDRVFIFIPWKKYMAILLDFKNSIVFIEGRKFVFSEKEAELLKAKLDFLLNTSPG